MQEERIIYRLSDIPIKTSTITMTTRRPLRGLHLHNAIEIIAVKKGMLACNVENEEFTVMAGQILIIKPRTIHRLFYAKDNTKFTYTQIELEKYLNEMWRDQKNSLWYKDIHYKIFKNDGDIAYIFSRLNEEIKCSQKSHAIYIKSLVFALISFLCRNDMIYDSTENTISDRRIIDIITYIEENLQEKISLDTLEKRFNLNKFHICRIFKAATDYSINEYINLLKINRAESLLVTTDLSITQIALECGFNTPQYFNIVFKKTHGVSPTQFKRLKH